MSDKRKNIGQRKCKKILNKMMEIESTNFKVDKLGIVYVKETPIMRKRRGK